MINPRSFIRTIEKQWSLIEQLVLDSNARLTWDNETLLLVLNTIHHDETPIQRQERLQQLINHTVLLSLPRCNAFELNPIVRAFAEQLLHQHELGLSDIIKTRIIAIKKALELLQDAVKNNDIVQLQRAIITLDQQLRDINQQLQNDADAIIAIVERAKAINNTIPLAQRYREVLDTYDNYIEPMNELMNSSADGSFYPLLEYSETVLTVSREQLITQGALYSHQASLVLVIFRLNEVRRLGRETLKRSTAELFPLREEIRRNSQLSTAITQLIGVIRKRGLKRVFIGATLPVWYKERHRHITIDGRILNFLAQAKNYQAQTVSFPEPIDAEQEIGSDYIDYSLIEQTIKQHLPITDLMQWLISYYDTYQDNSILKIYHAILHLPVIHFEQAEMLKEYTLRHHSISLYSYHLNNESQTQLLNAQQNLV